MSKAFGAPKQALDTVICLPVNPVSPEAKGDDESSINPYAFILTYY
jgi:hypothetical protein